MESREKRKDGNSSVLMAQKRKSNGTRKKTNLCHADYIVKIQGHRHSSSPATSPEGDELGKNDFESCKSKPLVENASTNSDDHRLGSRDELSSSRGGLSSTDELTSRSPSLDLVHDTRRKKKVNICTESSDDPLVVRTGTSSSMSVDEMRSDSELPSCKSPNSTDTLEPCLTLTGTIKRGRKAGQNVDVKLNISREELEIIEAAISEKNIKNPVCCVPVLLFTILCIPFVFLIACIYNFYMSLITWYNVFNYFSNGKKLCSKIFMPPILILLCPFLIVLFALLLGVYASVMQVSFDWVRWKQEVLDLEKGFFGWICSLLKLEDCCPYDVVIIMDVKDPNTGQIIETQQA